MRNIFRFTAVPALALVLAACGSDAGDAPAGDGGESVDTALAEGGDGPASEETAAAGTTDAATTGEAGEPAPLAAASAAASATAATPARTAAAAPPAAAPPAAAPPAAFATCGVCHSVNAGENRIGPSLAGVAGRRSGSVPGATYSPAMQAANVTWTAANLERYLADPAAIAPGGTMPNPGLNAEQRRAVIDYLKTL